MNNKDVIKQDNKAFIAEILDKREIRRDEIRNKRRRVKSFRVGTYIFQVLSFLTATYFIYHYVQDYAGIYAALVWVVGLVILGVIEVAKRYSILETAQGVYNPEDRHRVRMLPVVIIAVCASAIISYSGGSNFVKEENSGPVTVHNPEIDSIRQLIAAQEVTKAELATSKWKGALTRAARDGINNANAIIADLQTELRRLQKRDEYQNEALAMKHESKFNTFGYLFGGFAGFLDGLLLLLLFWAEKDETDVERWANEHGKATERPTQKTGVPSDATDAKEPLLRRVNSTTERNYDLDRATAQIIAQGAQIQELTEIVKALSDATGRTERPTVQRPTDGTASEKKPTVIVVDRPTQPTEKQRRKTPAQEQKATEKRLCLNCGTDISNRTARAKYCCDSCRKDYHERK